MKFYETKNLNGDRLSRNSACEWGRSRNFSRIYGKEGKDKRENLLLHFSLLLRTPHSFFFFQLIFTPFRISLLKILIDQLLKLLLNFNIYSFSIRSFMIFFCRKKCGCRDEVIFESYKPKWPASSWDRNSNPKLLLKLFY